MRDTIKASISAKASGRFVLRIDSELHSALREAARGSGLSLNDYCARKLAAPGSEVMGPAPRVVIRSASLFGGNLIGIVAFGSWSREELREDSDVDVLVVVDDGVEIARDLYRRWDADPLDWEARPVEPHFVHLSWAVRKLTPVQAKYIRLFYGAEVLAEIRALQPAAPRAAHGR